MYKQVPTSLNFVDREKAVEKFWEDNNIFKKSMEHRKEGETYTFYDGPPTANGKPHIGHVETRTIKDMIPRYRTMKGYMVPRKAGWDTHGLPVELEVEKLLGLDGKEQIEEYGLAPFIDKCKESVWKYKGMWEDFSRTVGFWADMDNPYVTYDDNFIESEWWALKTIWDKGLLYKGFKIVPYCPRCGTPLSSHEVAQGYKAVKERSAIVRFKVKGEDAYFLAWTTTPWTLPSNVALCVNPEETYLKVKAADGYTYYIAKALADKVLGRLAEEGKDAYEVLETYVGKDLEYKEYEPLYKCAGDAAKKQKKKAHFVTCDGYVTMTDGTGIVHIAPAFGEDDSRIGRNYELPFVQFVDGKGDLTAETPYAGKFVKDADPLVLKDLDAEGKLFDAPKFEHDYPFCWRCDTPLIYYARESWFIKMTAVKDGQKIAIVGPTGAGKTTMVKLLMRFYDLNGGSIKVDGYDIKDFNRSSLREMFGMVLQDTWLFSGTIMENIRYGRLDATDEEVIAAAKAAHVHNFIMQQPGGYQMVLDEETSNVSQGQKQLLTIARAILADNKILILDEATSSVDTRTEVQIQKAMDNLMKGRTSFVIAHRLSTIKDADLILVMKDGDIIEQGSHEELLAAKGFYADLYNSQFDKTQSA